MLTTKPFFQALESVLRNRIPSDEYAQILDESLWELESGAPGSGSGQASGARLASICVSFFRAMTKMGMRPESALESLALAGRKLHWKPDLALGRDNCPVVSYCRAKGAMNVCRAVFCQVCPEKEKGCRLNADIREDWTGTPGAKAP